MGDNGQEPLDGQESLPAFESGGRVERTGIALVHEGEYIVPAAASEALLSGGGSADGTVVNYYFPIQVEVMGSLPAAEVQRVANYVFDELSRELGSR